jgi:hypothetical protein
VHNLVTNSWMRERYYQWVYNSFRHSCLLILLAVLINVMVTCFYPHLRYSSSQYSHKINHNCRPIVTYFMWILACNWDLFYVNVGLKMISDVSRNMSPLRRWGLRAVLINSRVDGNYVPVCIIVIHDGTSKLKSMNASLARFMPYFSSCVATNIVTKCRTIIKSDARCCFYGDWNIVLW